MTEEISHKISNKLRLWYSEVKRDLPWRRTKNPYKIWLSEIILQQTRVDQGLSYYERFVKYYPNVCDLAKANENQVLRLWQGLGYYSRAINLHKTAKIICEGNGYFPVNYIDLIKLPGIGPYTAAAIASIAFEKQVPVLDGNVYRVISRIYELGYDISNTSNRKYFIEILNLLLASQIPSVFNQSLMELGALVCTPKLPKCPECPVRDHCSAKKNKSQFKYPRKNKVIKRKKRYFQYIIFIHKNKIGFQKRKDNDIWSGLFEFFLIEGEDVETPIPSTYTSKIYKTILTHQEIFTRFHHVNLFNNKVFEDLLKSYKLQPFTDEQILDLPKPQLIVNYLKKEKKYFEIWQE